ncbi:MAG: hypothetical protein AAF557_12660 [Pseudomonadota bacterium]
MSGRRKYFRIKIFGERGTGTNFVTQMIHANFQVEVLLQPDPSSEPGVEKLKVPGLKAKRQYEIADYIEDRQHKEGLTTFGGWKHACLTDKVADRLKQGDETLFICVLRHPALWAKSFHREPFASFLEPAEDLATFLRHPWVARTRDEVPDLVLDSPAILWRLKTQSYLDQAEIRPNVVTVRQDDFLRDHETVLEGLSAYLERRDDVWKIVTSYGRQWASNKRDFWTIRREMPDEPFEAVGAEVTGILRDHIGDELIRRAGYRLPGDAS